MFELIAILGVAMLVWFIMTQTDLAKNLAKILTRPVTLTSLNAEQQEIMERASEPDICSSSVGGITEVLTKIPTSINMQPTPFETVENPDLGTLDVPNRVLNNYLDDKKGETITRVGEIAELTGTKPYEVMLGRRR